MEDAIARYRAASEANDIEALLATLDPDAEVISPISGRMVFRGREDLRILLTAVYGSLTGLRWRLELGDGSTRVLAGDMRIGPVRMTDAMVFDLEAQNAQLQAEKAEHRSSKSAQRPRRLPRTSAASDS